jgi:hypothetical protein
VASLLGIAGLLSITSSVGAVEYRLQVVNLYADALASYVELADGMTGPGLERLIGTLNGGDAPAGILLYDRAFPPASEATTKLYSAVPAFKRRVEDRLAIDMAPSRRNSRGGPRPALHG